LGKYPVGQPVLMAAAESLGARGLLNPLFGALSAAMVYYLGRRVYGERTGRYASLLAASSFFLLLHSSAFTGHAPTMFFMLAFQLFFLKSLEGECLLNPLVAGLALGFGMIIRPYTALAFLLPYAVYFVFTKAGGRGYLPLKAAMAKAAVFVIAVSLFAAVFAAHNKAITGSFLTPGHLYFDPNDRPWFGTDYHTHDDYFTPVRAVANAWRYLVGLLDYPLEGGRVVMLLALFAFLLRRRLSGFDLLFTATACSLLVFYSLYHHQEFVYGPRYLLEVVPLLLLLVVRAFEGFNDERLQKILVIAALCSMLLYIPGSVGRYNTAYQVNGRYSRMFEALESGLEENTIVFVDTSVYPSVISRNNWDFGNDKVVYARYASPAENLEFASRYFSQYDCRTFTIAEMDGMLEDCRK
ncbi:MAG: glycosyltransferase family 39 protein, partial [Candidatus Altiarchaeota archaeon]|nr:glycosyltransferase family 39 protein [Candidatus Altiarchaeota archaeon]